MTIYYVNYVTGSDANAVIRCCRKTRPGILMQPKKL